MKNAALYLRVSTEGQDFERQKDELMNLATSDGCWENEITNRENYRNGSGRSYRSRRFN